MRATATSVAAEAELLTLAERHRWQVHAATRENRKPDLPTFVLWRPDTDVILAVFVRPRRLSPSERPSTAGLPAAFTPVVWHPGMSALAAWLRSAVLDPPGLLERRGA